MQEQKIEIRLNAYDHKLVDNSAELIVSKARTTGAMVSGPIPLPNRKRKYSLLASPHVNKDARNPLEICNHSRLVIIKSPTQDTIDALMRSNLAAGVEVLISVAGK